MDIKERIAELCSGIESEKGIKILFAVENGSRAWRLASKDSDYDVRFVYHRPIAEYVQINLPGDVIEKAFDSDLNPCPVEGSFIDLVGFDIFKFVKLLSSSNPSAIEWLTSDIVYYGEQNKVFKEFALKNANMVSMYWHYKSMCKSNYIKYLKVGNQTTYKKYLYAMRGLLNARWVTLKGTVPPIKFNDVLDGLIDLVPSFISDKLLEIIRLKTEGREGDIVQNIVQIDEYIESFLKDDSDVPDKKSYVALTELNSELRRIVLDSGACPVGQAPGMR